MRILVVGATGTIGNAVVQALEARHEVLRASHTRSPLKVDLGNADSIRQLYATVGRVDAVVSAAGQAAFRPLFDLTDDEFALSLGNKLMGQVNLVRLGLPCLADRGSITLTGGTLSRYPMPGGAAFSIVNAALEGFVRAAATEVPRGIRVNAVAPGWVRETRVALKMDPAIGVPAAVVAEAYVQCVEGEASGEVFDAAENLV